MFNSAHDAVVRYALEGDGVNDTTVPATLPAAPEVEGILGYCDLPETSRGLNNSKGFAIGQQGAAYNKRGRREPSVTVTLRPGNVGVLDYLFPENSVGDARFEDLEIDPGRFAPMAIYVQVKNGYVDQYRYCKPSNVSFNFSGGDGQGGELTISVTFQAMAYVRATSSDFPSAANLRALGTPLMWHDVRSLVVSGNQIRRSVLSLTASLDMGLERKNERPNWGDDHALSNTCYDMLEHHKTVTGEFSLHERLPETLFSTKSGDANTSQDWGSVVVVCSDSPAGGSKGFTLTLSGCFPTNETMQGGESSREIDYTIPFTADDISFAIETH